MIMFSASIFCFWWQ